MTAATSALTIAGACSTPEAHTGRRDRACGPEKPDVIVASSPLVLQALQQVTRNIPIVFVQITDPVGSGFVASMAHPGGNITGFATGEFSMYGKSLEFLKEIAPQVTR